MDIGLKLGKNLDCLELHKRRGPEIHGRLTMRGQIKVMSNIHIFNALK